MKSVNCKKRQKITFHRENSLFFFLFHSSIPSQGNTADVSLTVFHQNFTGDEFLGTVNLPLSSFDVYQQPRAKYRNSYQIYPRNNSF